MGALKAVLLHIIHIIKLAKEDGRGSPSIIYTYINILRIMSQRELSYALMKQQHELLCFFLLFSASLSIKQFVTGELTNSLPVGCSVSNRLGEEVGEPHTLRRMFARKSDICSNSGRSPGSSAQQELRRGSISLGMLSMLGRIFVAVAYATIMLLLPLNGVLFVSSSHRIIEKL
uniref:Putative ovule protein n=1 Tax=Solanum chacoense TaxID=4108 RepID=A0A0V0H8J5_SOLCH